MKSRIIIIIVTLVFNFNFVNAQIHKYAPEVVLIGVGEKNPTFDETRYPDLKFYYTPKLISEVSSKIFTKNSGIILSGTPEFVKTIWNNKNFKNGFMLFDKNGVCVSMGYDIMRQNDIGSRLCADKSKLSDNLRNYVKKGKTGKMSKKEMKLKKSNFMVGYKMPKYNVTNLDGESVGISSICDSGKPTLVIFFNIPKNLDLNVASKIQHKKTGKGFFKAMVEGARGSKQQNLFIELESEFFQYDARQ